MVFLSCLSIVEALINLQDIIIISRYPVRIYTDHRNLAFILRTDAAPGPLSQARLGRLERWAIKIQHIPYEIHHIEGTNNGWSEYLSRKTDEEEDRNGLDSNTNTLGSIRHNVIAMDSPAWIQPTLIDLRAASFRLSSPPIPGAVWDPQRELWLSNGLIYIPEDSSMLLRERLLRLPHHSHPSGETQALMMAKHICWKGMRGSAIEFCKDCNPVSLLILDLLAALLVLSFMRVSRMKSFILTFWIYRKAYMVSHPYW
jgi:hypothetical protein